ncbi:MAG: O-antigen ligase family protein [Candidatus Levybacteria bacterium]|nr:O-antigen ligase family protein [Candidatus Levybacteria bacterium]
MGLLKYLFILVLIVFPLGQIARFEFGNGVAVTLNDIAVGILFLTWVIVGLLKKNKIKGSLLCPIAIFSAISLISLLLNTKELLPSQFLTAFFYLMRWVFYSAIFFIVSGFDKKFKEQIITLMTVCGALVILFGFIQYFFYPALRNLYYLGWDEHLYRLFSTFLDPNFAGAFFVLYFILVLASFFKELKNKKRLPSILFFILTIASLASIYLTYSRSAIIMLFVSSSVFFILLGKKKLILGLLGVSALVFILFSRNFYIENLNLLRIASSEARLESAQNAIKIIQKNPVFGVGFNAYRYAQIKYGFRSGPASQISHADAGTDNSFLFVFATTGIFGLFSYLFLIKKIFKRSLYSKKENGSRKFVAIILISSLSGIIVDSLFINSLFYVFIMEWIWILAGLNESK